MDRQLITGAVAQPTEVDNSIHTGGGRRVAQVCSASGFPLFPLDAITNVVDQVVDEIHPVNGTPEITLNIALDDLDPRSPWGAIKFLWRSSEAPHLVSGI